MENHSSRPQGTCLIVGCGYVGTRLALRRKGEGPVLALVRRIAAAEVLREMCIAALVADVESAPLNLPVAPGAVVYLVPPSGQGSEDLCLAAFLRALDPERPEVFLYLSTTGVYGDTGGAAVDEDSLLAPREDRSRQRLDAEQRVAMWCQERGIRCVVFRVPAIYGPHRLPMDRLQRGEPVLRDEDSGPGNRIHVDDLVGACVAALDHPVSGVFNLTDGQPESMAAFTTRVATLAGLPPPRKVSWADAQTLMSPGILTFLRESRLIKSRRRPELAWQPRYVDLDEGLRASLREMGL